MKKILKQIAFSLLGLIILIVVIAFLLPAEQKLEVSVRIDAPMQLVFDQVNDVRNWVSWAPWKIADPLLEMSYSNPPAGKGAFLHWQSTDPKIGSGKLTLAEVIPQQNILVVVDHHTLKDYTSEIHFADARGKTRVTWSTMYQLGRNPLLRYRGLFGKGARRQSFEDGLNALKLKLETR